MTLKQEIVGACSHCDPDGFKADEYGTVCVPCDCLLKFRAYNRLISGGFCQNTLDYATASGYNLPMVEEGDPYLTYFLNNIEQVEKDSLGLFIYSNERGRGKTTLAHYLMYHMAKYLSDLAHYRSTRTYVFEKSSELLKDARSRKPKELWRSTWYVLDDLGNEDRSNNWSKEAMISVLQDLFQYRRPKGLPIIITSNYSPSDLSSLYGGVLDSLMEIKADGHIGGSLYKEVKVGGAEDLRTLEENSKWDL